MIKITKIEIDCIVLKLEAVSGQLHNRILGGMPYIFQLICKKMDNWKTLGFQTTKLLTHTVQ